MFAWEQRKLGEVATFINGRAYKQNELLDSGKYKVLRVGNFYTNDSWYYSNLELADKYYIDEGDLVYTWSATFGPHIWNGEKVIYHYHIWKIELSKFLDRDFTLQILEADKAKLLANTNGSTMIHVTKKDMESKVISLPSIEEQKKIGSYLMKFDSLITLHQRKPFIKNGGIKMITSNFTCDSLFKDYFEFWIKLYKEGAVRPVTLEKYRNNQKHITKIIPNLKMKDFDRNAYQELLNQYALTHERQTVIDFHHQVKGAILDAVDDGLIDRDPTRKAIFKGKAPREKKQKYLNQFELHNLLEDLDLGMEITWDWLILLIAKTGLRFSEALGLTPADFDFARQTISVNKTWDYKTNTGFQPTKNRSSIRKVQMDWQLGMQFQHLIKNLNEDEPIFVNGPVCNSTPNNCLARHCRKCGIPEISIHGLRHTHASLLMFAGVSIASVSRRLGHSSITTTQKVYMHIISELENQDNDLVMRYLSSLS